MIWRIKVLLIGLLAVIAGPSLAATCTPQRFDGHRFTVCSIDMTQSKVRLFLRDETGAPYGHFAALPQGVQIAMNGGMYHADRRPVGHYVENGVEEMRVVPNAGPGNFGMLPNGVLCLREGQAQVIETLRFIDQAPDCTHASQSGPMLVIDGVLHPRFIPGSTSRKRRNGVGTSADGLTMYWAMSNGVVNFDTFARLFRDALAVPNALFIDGTVSRLYAPELGRNDGGPAMGPILAVVD